MGSCPHRRIRPLGEGAVGDVHLCIDAIKRRTVVVKWLRAEVHEHSEAASRFRREAELMSQSSFAGVIQVDEYGVDDYGRTWMAMEFVDGLNPAAVIGPGDGWSAHRLLSGVGMSLDELHGLGVVHRDLKPDNVLLSGTDTGWDPVIIDLGIAKWLSEEAATATGSVFGTPHYMSPEQFRDTKHVGPATDRYALAVICFELLSGRLPYDGRNLPELLRQHMESDIPPLLVPRPSAAGHQGLTKPDMHEPDVLPSPNLDAFMRRAMAKQPRDRYFSSAEMGAAFQAAATADGFWAPPTGPQPLFEPLGNPVIEINGGSGVMHFRMADGPVTLGRHENSQYTLNSPRLSRLHAAIYRHRGRLWIADLHSQNGTVYQGSPMTAGIPMPLPTDGTATHVRLYDQEITIRTVPGA